MSDVYKVAVSLAISSNAGTFLPLLSKQILGVHGDVAKLQKGLDSATAALTRMKLAIGGGLALVGGAAMLSGLKHVTNHARELSKELATLKTQGLTEIQIKGADQAARSTTRIVPGSTESGNLKILSEAYSLMGLENAKKALPALARTVQVFGGIDGNYKGARESMYSLIRSGEMLGKLQDHHTGLIDPVRLKGFLDTMARVAAATGNKVNAQTLFGMVQQGAPALANMSDDGLMSMLMAAQQMGGHRAGTAMTSLYQQMIGGTMTKAKAEELSRLGLVGKFNVGRGGHLTFPKGSLETPFARALEKDPLGAMKILQDTMSAHGITSMEAQTKKLFTIFGRQTTQRLVSDFIRNLPNMQDEQGRIKKGQGLDEQARTRNEEDYAVVEHNMHEAWTNLMEAVAGPQSKAAIGIMHQITDTLNDFTDVVRDMNPATLTAIGKGLAVTGAALMGAGAAALLAAIGPAGWVVGGVTAMIGAWAAADGAGFKATLTALTDTAVSVYRNVSSFVSGSEVFTRLSMFWALAKSEALIVSEKIKGFVGDGAALMTMMKGTLATDTGDLAAIKAGLTYVYDWYKTILGWRQSAQDMITGLLGNLFGGGKAGNPGMSESAREAVANRMKLEDPMGRIVTALITEFKSWPDRLGEAITTMGANIVKAIGDKLKGVIGNGLFGDVGPQGTSFEGGSGIAGMIRKASYGGANDNVALGRGGAGRTVPRGAFGPGTGAGNSWYEAIMRAEGTAGKDPYNVVLGNGRYGLPSKPLTDMTLAEAYAFGRTVRARHGASSAIGAFQIVGQTMKTFMGEAGLTWSDKFSPENQRKLAAVIAKRQGFRAWEGFKVHPGELGNARQMKPIAETPAPTAPPPPPRRDNKPIMVDLQMDGKKMGRAIAAHQADDHLFPKSAGGMDTHGSWRAPGTPVTDAA